MNNNLQLIQSGYIQGKFEKSLPLFMIGQKTHYSSWDTRKRNLKNEGSFNVKVVSKHVHEDNLRGYILPVKFCDDEQKRDVFLKLQRLIKKNRKKRDFTTIIDKYLSDIGYEYLKLSNYSPRYSYLQFKIDENIYSKFLQDFYYATKILDAKGKVIEILETKKFTPRNYIKFLEEIYTKEKLIKYDIYPFHLIYIYENVVGTDDVYSIDKDFQALSLSRYNLHKYFTIPKDTPTSKLTSINYEIIGHGWIDILFKIDDINFTISCSGVFDPFLDIYTWLILLKNDNKSHILKIDEEGSVVVFEAYSFNDLLYLKIYTEYNKEEEYFEGIMQRDNFLNTFYHSLENFILNIFYKCKGDSYWEGNIKILEGIFKKNLGSVAMPLT